MFVEIVLVLALGVWGYIAYVHFREMPAYLRTSEKNLRAVSGNSILEAEIQKSIGRILRHKRRVKWMFRVQTFAFLALLAIYLFL